MDLLAEQLRGVRDELQNVVSKLDTTNQILPTLQSELSEEVAAAQARTEVALAKAIEVDNKFKSRNRWINAAVIVPLVVFILVLFGLVRAAASTNELTEQIRDCVTETGECFKENRLSLDAQNKKTVSEVNAATEAQIKGATEALTAAIIGVGRDLQENNKLRCFEIIEVHKRIPPEGTCGR